MFGSGYIQVKDMVKSGLLLKVIGIFVVFAGANLWLDPIFPNKDSYLMGNITNSSIVSPPACACP